MLMRHCIVNDDEMEEEPPSSLYKCSGCCKDELEEAEEATEQSRQADQPHHLHQPRLPAPSQSNSHDLHDQPDQSAQMSTLPLLDLLQHEAQSLLEEENREVEQFLPEWHFYWARDIQSYRKRKANNISGFLSL